MAEYTLSAEIIPELSRNFSRDVQRMIKESLAKVEASVKVSAKVDASQLQREVNRAARESKASVKIKTELDSSQLQRELNRAARETKASVSVKAIIDASRLQRDLDKAARGAKSRITVSPDLNDKMVKAKLDNLTQRTRTAKIKADLDDVNARLKLAKIADVNRKIQIKAELDKKSAEKFENEASALAKRANLKFRAIMFAGAFAGLPAAAAIAGAGVVAGLAGVPLLFTGIAAVALKSNAEVITAFDGLKNHVVADTKEMASTMAGPLAGAATQLGASFDRIKPSLLELFRDSVPALTTFTSGVTGLVERSMPGLVVAAQNSQAPMRGLRDLLNQVGDGTTRFFTTLSGGAASSEGVIRTVGGLVSDLLGFAGSLFANLSNSGGPILTQFRGALGQVEDVILTLTSPSGGMPALTGLASGFMGTVGGGLGILRGFASALGSWARPIGDIGGSLIGTNFLLRAFGTSLSDQGFGLKGFQKSLTDANGQAISPFKKALQDAETNGTSKLKAGTNALVSSGFNPLGIAMIGAGYVLDQWGQKQQEAASRASGTEQRVRDMTAAFDQSRGAIDNNTSSLALQQLQTFDAGKGTINLLDATSKLAGPQGMELLTQAAGGNTQSLDQLRTKLRGMIDQAGPGSKQALQILAGSIDSWAGSMVTAHDKAQQLHEQQRQLNLANGDVTHSQKLTEQSTVDLAKDFVVLADSTKSAEEKGKALQDVLDKLHGRAPSYEEAQQQINDSIRALATEFGAGTNKADGWGRALINADGTVNTASKNGSELQNTLTTLHKGFADSAGAIDQLVQSGVPYEQAVQRVNGDLSTQRQRFIDQHDAMGLTAKEAATLADKYGLIPRDVTTSVRIANAGTASEAIRALSADVVGVPNSKDITFRTLSSEAEAKLTSLGFTVTHMPDGTVRVTANTDAARTDLNNFVAETNISRATAQVFGNTDPAKGAVQNWKDVTTATHGTTTTYTYTDPATHAVTQWSSDTNDKSATTKTFTNTDPATGQLTTWLQTNDGKTINVNAALKFNWQGASQEEIATWLRGTAFVKPGTQLGSDVGFATGGEISGPGSGTSDNVPIWASNGEFMMKTAAVQKYGTGFMHSVNSGKFAAGGPIGRYASGGPVLARTASLGDPHLAAAAREILTAWQRGAQVFEDFSFKGMSKNAATYNDQLVNMVHGNISQLAAVASSTTASNNFTPALGGATGAAWGSVGGFNAAGVAAGGSVGGFNAAGGAAGWSVGGFNAAGGAAGGSVGGFNAAGGAAGGAGGAMTNLQNTVDVGVLPSIVRLGQVSEQVWNALQQQGWRGDPRDGQEALHAPDGLEAAKAEIQSAWSRGVPVFEDNSFRGMSANATHWLANGLDNSNWHPHAKGGAISGPGGPTGDKIPSLLSDGEFVLKTAAVRHYGLPLLQSMNAMRFANGGVVGRYAAGGPVLAKTATLGDPRLASAAREILSAWQRGAQVFEDFSFRGMSDNAATYNDQLVGMVHGNIEQLASIANTTSATQGLGGATGSAANSTYQFRWGTESATGALKSFITALNNSRVSQGLPTSGLDAAKAEIQAAWEKGITVFEDNSFKGMSANASRQLANGLDNSGWHPHATGGAISGPGGPTGDKIPSLLSDGEFVFKAAAVQRYGLPLLESMNAMRFAAGGVVGAAASTTSAAASATSVPSLPQIALPDPAQIDAVTLALQALAAVITTITPAVTTLSGAFNAAAAAMFNVENHAQTLFPAAEAVLLASLATIRGEINSTSTSLNSALAPAFFNVENHAQTLLPAANAILFGSLLAARTDLNATAGVLNSALAPAFFNVENHAQTLFPAAGVILAGSLLGLRNELNTTSGVLNSNLAPAFFNVENHAQTLMPAANNTLITSNTQMAQSQRDLTATMSTAWTDVNTATTNSVTSQTTAHENLKNSLALVRTAFTDTANWANQEFTRAYAAAADPIRNVINLPIHGLVDAWNSLDGQFGFGKHIDAPVAAFKSGGFVSGSGTGTSDSIPAKLSNGEFVIREKVTRRVAPFLSALNDGQPEALHAAGFASGGLVGDTGSAVNASVLKAQIFAKAQDGKPYVWGGVGPDGYDCSGFMSAITNVLRGETNPYHRLGVAESQPWPGFATGLGSAFSTGFNSTHTAGTLGGINAEAGSTPIHFGGAAAGADSSQFTGHAFLPIAGGKFVSGGGGGSGIDVAALINSAFAAVSGQLDAADRAFPGNIAAGIGAGVARQASDRIKGQATDRITALSGSAGDGVAGTGPVADQVRAVAARFGWGDGGQWASLDWLLGHESGWNPTAQNPTSTAYGLFQFLDSTWASLGGTKTANPGQQAELGLKYIQQRYGSPSGAQSFWQANHWYDEGGMIQPGRTSVINDTGKPEAVLTPKETAAYQAQAQEAARGDKAVRLDQHSINKLAAAIMAAAEKRPVKLTVRDSLGGIAGMV